ncbi:hypothetical protein CASFOL_037881 [Castilleja foliolosa]|uniref:Uncharacterized protein n=1 Tax=Castilleja foliolosa TaxID=1961234 RepID=A0ABD3BLE7_9LAMI
MSHYISPMEEIHQEMQLLSFTNTTPPQYDVAPPHPWPPSSRFDGPSLDLQLSISVTPMKKPNNNVIGDHHYTVETLRWQAAEQIRLAAMERAYAERLMEMTRREMELAQSEFVRARNLWDRAREEVGKAERMKERAFRISADSMCMEITCMCCTKKFRP